MYSPFSSKQARRRLTHLPSRLADVAGTKEPIYGPSAIRSVAEQAKETPYTELKRADMKWHAMNTTSVETFSFYILGDNGYAALAQVIYSNVAYAIITFLHATKYYSWSYGVSPANH